MIYLPNKGKRGRMSIGFLPIKERIRGARANPMHFYSLGELASEERKETSISAPATRSKAPTRLGW